MNGGVVWTNLEESGLLVGCGDWLDGVRSLSEGMPAGKGGIDLMYVDPPFNTGKVQRADSGEYEDRWDSIEAYLGWLRERLEATIALIKESGSILVHVDWRTSHRVRTLLDDVLGADCFVNHLIWSYGLGGSSPRRFARKHDDILFYSKTVDGHWFEPPMVDATSQRMKGQKKKATDVLDIPSLNNMASERVGYPTQKPVALLEVLVRACCPDGGMVLDPCCGSGTTLVAATKSGRRAIGIDRSERAIEVTISRLGKIRT